MRHDFFSVITGHMCERMKLYRQYNKVRLSRVLFVMSWMVCSIDWTVLNLAGENWSECAPYCDLKTNLLTTLKLFTRWGKFLSFIKKLMKKLRLELSLKLCKSIWATSKYQKNKLTFRGQFSNAVIVFVCFINFLNVDWHQVTDQFVDLFPLSIKGRLMMVLFSIVRHIPAK